MKSAYKLMFAGLVIAALVASIQAPRKEFVTIPGAGHFAVFMKTDEFLQELLGRVRPLAEKKPR